MKTKSELEKDILNITMKIHEEFPELSRYLKEMPVNVTEEFDGRVSIKDLDEYYNSLLGLVKTYMETHVGIKVKR
jgi:hypothetical protein